jgi:hypothetical protein
MKEYFICGPKFLQNNTRLLSESKLSHDEKSLIWKFLLSDVIYKRFYLLMRTVKNCFRDRHSLKSSKIIDKIYYVLFPIPVYVEECCLLGSAS